MSQAPHSALYSTLFERLAAAGLHRRDPHAIDGRPGEAEWITHAAELVDYARVLHRQGLRGVALATPVAVRLYRDLVRAGGDRGIAIPDDERLREILIPSVEAMLAAARRQGKAQPAQRIAA